MATPESSRHSPVAAKKTGLVEASNKEIVPPDAFLKRPVPPVTWNVLVQWATGPVEVGECFSEFVKTSTKRVGFPD